MHDPSRPSSVLPDLTSTLIDGGYIQVLDRIGQGSFGAIYRAHDMTAASSKVLAVKVISNTFGRAHLWREALYHSKVSGHPNVAKLHRFVHDEQKDFVYLVLDYCPGGDLWRAIMQNHMFVRNDDRIRNIFLQLIDALSWCHKRGIYHRDLKPNNILIDKRCTKIWLTDFGLSTEAPYSNSWGAGTQQYRSPECNNFRKRNIAYCTKRNDIWAIGMILMNMITENFPWHMTSMEDGWYLAYRKDPNFLRYTMPISIEAAQIFRRVFVNEQSQIIDLQELRKMVERVKTFFMSDADIAAGPPHLRRNARRCRVGFTSSDPWQAASRASSNSIGSLADDSDDSDEHSNGLRTRSLLAVEEGLAPAHRDGAQDRLHPALNFPAPTSMSLPLNGIAINVLPPSGGVPPTDACPSRDYGQLAVSSNHRSSSSDNTQTPATPTTPEGSKGKDGEQKKAKSSFWSKVPRKLKLKRLFSPGASTQ